MEALEPFSCEAPRQDPPVLPYLQERRRRTWDINLMADIIPAGRDKPCRVAKTNLSTMYFTWPQMIAHHTLGGCNLRTGDVLGSGTVSSGGVGQRGCLFEATSGGRQAVVLTPETADGDHQQESVGRFYLEDGDSVVLSGWCGGGEGAPLISFGECRGKVLPSHSVVVSL